MKSVGAELVELAMEKEFAPLHKKALESESWILVDCVDVIIHIFSEESRHYYDLENLWGEAKRVAWEPLASKK